MNDTIPFPAIPHAEAQRRADPRAAAPEMTTGELIRAGQAGLAVLAAKQSREFQALLAVIVEMAEELGGADSIQPVGVCEVARRLAEHLAKEQLTLTAISGRVGR